MEVKDLFGILYGKVYVYKKDDPIWILIPEGNINSYSNYKVETIYARECNVFDVYVKENK